MARSRPAARRRRPRTEGDIPLAGDHSPAGGPSGRTGAAPDPASETQDAPGAQRGTPRYPRNAEATRHRILHAALGGFAWLGFDGVSLDDLARSVGISKPTLFYYFPSKVELYAEVTRAVAADFSPLARRLPDESPSAESLERLVGDAHDLLAGLPEAGVLLLREAIDRREGGANVAFEPFVDLIAGYVGRGQRAGVFTDELDAREVVDSIIGSFALFFLGAHHFLARGREVTPEAVASHRASAITFVRRALLADAAASPRTKSPKSRRTS